jgi:tRNA G18 (ribose-2'-O)-methylase SpoU
VNINRGYLGIGIYHVKTACNIGTLWRSAYNFGASFIFTIGKRYKKQHSDTLKAHRHIPLYHYVDFKDFKNHTPHNCKVIAIEQSERSKDIKDYKHPERAIYLLGAEDHGIPIKLLDQCHEVIHIDTPQCLNVSSAGSIVMYDRQMKGVKS